MDLVVEYDLASTLVSELFHMSIENYCEETQELHDVFRVHAL